MPTILRSQFKPKCVFSPQKSFSCEYAAALPDSSCSLMSWGSEPLQLRHSLCTLVFRVAISSSVASPLSPWEHKMHNVSHSAFLSHHCFSSDWSWFSDRPTHLQGCLPLVKPLKTHVKAKYSHGTTLPHLSLTIKQHSSREGAHERRHTTLESPCPDNYKADKIQFRYQWLSICKEWHFF